MNKGNKRIRITHDERVKIEGWISAGVTQKKMAELLERGQSTISEEIKRGTNKYGVYSADYGDHRQYIKQYWKKKECSVIARCRALQIYIERRIRQGLSPEQISVWLRNKQRGLPYISAKGIRRWIQNRARYLHHLLFWSRNKKKTGRKRGTDIFLSDPERRKVGLRDILFPLHQLEYGHWEGDFIVSKHNSTVLLVLVERYSKYTIIEKLETRENTLVNQRISQLLEGHTVESITFDNDIAFKRWKELEQLLDTTIFFTEPYCSWQKGLVENMNRWIRCYIPKKSDIAQYSTRHIQSIQDYLNNLPRVILGGSSAYEITTEYKKDCIVQSGEFDLPVWRG